MELKIKTAAAVGAMITSVVTTLAKSGEKLHETMVQCALHAQQHGDTSLVERLINELTANPDDKLRGAAMTNVQGVRFWFGTFCPLTMNRDGKVKLMDKDGDAYSKFVQRATKAFGAADEAVQRSGNRAFFIKAGADRPFWDMDDVKKAQRNNIRVIGASTLVGNVLKLETDLTKAIENGLIPPTSVDLAKRFAAEMAQAARKFREENAAFFLAEPEAMAEQKDKKEHEPEAENLPQVGGNVTSGMSNEDADAEAPPRTGTDG